MAKTFKTLTKKIPRERQERISNGTAKLLAEMPLYELRSARSLTQENIAKTLGTNQTAVSRLERRADLYISTLRDFIVAMGGELDIIARFPDGEVRINKFGEV
jgi:ParB-like chromosome segregation protein Spo0J